MTNKEIENIQNNVAASLAVEGVYVSPEAKEINKRFLEGMITSEEAIESIKSFHKIYDLKGRWSK